MKKIAGAVFYFFLATMAFAQKQDRAIVQFSGIVNNSDSTHVIVPYASITNTSEKNQVNVSNYKGYFSFVAHELDTIRFSCVGYATAYVVIPQNLPSKSYTIQVLLKPQIFNLPVFRVFPWATTEEFTKDFLTMKLADDDLEIVKKNISRASIAALRRTLPRDGSESNSFQGFHDDVVNSHSTVNPLLNPFNWGAFIKELSDGDKARGVSGN